MSSITTAKKSPRIENGKISWYEGDTFSIKLNIALTASENGDEIILQNGDEIKVVFYRNDICVHKFIFKSFTDNCILMNFDEAVSKKFNKGVYSYSILYSSLNRTTIVANNEVEVE